MAKKNSETKKQIEPPVEPENSVKTTEPVEEIKNPVETAEQVEVTEPVEEIENPVEVTEPVEEIENPVETAEQAEEIEHAEESNTDFINSVLSDEAVYEEKEVELELEEEFEANRAKDILKKNLIANAYILHGGKQYKPGEILPCSDIEMVELWCLHKSAHWE